MTGKQIAAIFGISLLAAIISAAVHPQRPPFFQVESAETLRWQIDVEKANELSAAGEVLWVDAREREKFEEGHLEGAILLNVEEWGDLMFQNMNALQAALGKPVVVYCDGIRCEKSEDVSARLRELLGLEPVYVLKGDWREIQ